MKEGPLRIAHVDAEMGFSGGEVQVFLLLEGLRERGHENIVFCRPGSGTETEARARGFEVRTVPMRNYLDLPSVWGLTRGFRDADVDLVQLHTGRATWLGGVAAHRAGLPAVTTRRMDREVKPGRRTRKIYTELTARVVAISPGVVDCLRAADVPEDRIVSIPDAVDEARLQPTRPGEAVREELGVAADAVFVLGVGALYERKGFDVLLEALAQLDDDVRGSLAVRIAGDGPEHEALEAQAARLGLTEVVRLLGRREDLGDLLAACDVFVLPSRREGLGVAALEAMAAGRAVIASNVGGLAGAVEHERTGLHVPPADPAALAEAITRLVGDETLRASLGAHGPKRIDEGFRASQVVEAYEALYREVLAGRA